MRAHRRVVGVEGVGQTAAEATAVLLVSVTSPEVEEIKSSPFYCRRRGLGQLEGCRGKRALAMLEGDAGEERKRWVWRMSSRGASFYRLIEERRAATVVDGGGEATGD